MSEDGERATEPAAAGGGWPPPHPSPPLPPPREYGSPGTPPRRAPYVVGAAVLAVVVVVALLVVLLGGEGGDAADRTADDPTTPTATESASETPVPSFTCWDGTGAAALEECSAPTGEAGLRWLFPVMDQARCGQASATGEPGLVTRVLCVHRFADGTRAQLSFFEWESVEQGRAFYDAQGLDREETPEWHTWTGVTGQVAKAVVLYADAPYSLTLTFPARATPSPEDQAALAPRPVAELRGVPAQ